MTISFERAHYLFAYSRETGVLSRKVPVGNRALTKGAVGYADKDGYLIVKVDGRALKTHRLIWFMETGAWPTGDIDHINGGRADNRWDNLRDVPHSTNNENLRRARADNVSGYLGVSIRPNGAFYATICHDRRVKHLGSFKTPEQAHAAYLSAKRQIHQGNTL